ncbi:MAG: hypothetical protein ACRD2G_05455, partial [Terriglobia bacterium]
MHRKLIFAVMILGFTLPLSGQTWQGAIAGLTQAHDYVSKRSSSYDRTGGNADYRHLAPGKTLTLLDANGPGDVAHVWMTINDRERFHLKKLVLRMYWDGETTPSV